MMSDEATPREDAATANGVSHPDLPEANPPAEDPAPAAESAEPREFVIDVPGVGTYKGETQEEVIQKMQDALLSSAEHGRDLHNQLQQAQTTKPDPVPSDTPTGDQQRGWREIAESLALPPEETQALFLGMMNELAAPMMGVQAADSKLTGVVEGYDPGKLDQFINSNSEVAETYGQMVNVNPMAAREWAFGKQRASSAGRELARARDQAKTDAGQTAEDLATAATVTQRHRAADVQSTTDRDARLEAINRYHETGGTDDSILDAVMPLNHPELWMGEPEKP